ncbi:aminodeoxychorismate synthase [Skeletonema marinoi]|uniref:aminodeoxychorismate synthase n=1 Tax=Skeletonema marinoi TaxID=267567 RepID=A0AAD8YNT5_9STRA|nr:aminodeoxychorismate synthase [Skeletonema marinoi]
MTTYPVKVVMNDAFSTLDEFIDSLDESEGRSSGDKSNFVLGHQALGYVYGKEVTLAPCGPVHGLMSSVYYNSNQQNESDNDDDDADDEREQLSCQLFRGIQQNFNVVRYHSLVVDFPDDAFSGDSEIESIAWCKGLVGNEEEYPSDICMALRHKQYPHVGVQFHPESIGTGEAGYQIIRNFCDFAYQYKMNNKKEGLVRGESIDAAESSLPATVQLKTNDLIASKTSHHQIYIHKLEGQSSSSSHPEEVFQELFSSRENSFWLDSSTGKTQLDNGEDNEGCPIISNSRFSIMGSNDGPLSRKIEYFGIEHPKEKRGLRVTLNSGNTETSTIDTDILSYLRQTLIEDGGFSDHVHMVSFNETEGDQTFHAATDIELPFDYRGGYVGFLGYELRHITQCSLFELEGGHGCTINDSDASRERTNPNVPTAAFFFADRSLLFDHHTGDWYLVGVANKDEYHIDDMLGWMKGTQAQIEAIGKLPSSTISSSSFVPNRPKDQYQMDIARSHEEIRNGESYELCVTNQLEAEITLPKRSDKKLHESPFDLYKILRTNNPAPFSAFMNFYNKDDDDSSDALLLSPYAAPHQNGESESSDMVKTINDRIMQELRDSTKDQAENLMIVDLLRNDLGRVCEVGSVHVPYLMNIESYATVHQMVSTVRGNLDGNTSNAIDVIEACFPGGSMTGAPKQRTMEILNEIEEGVSRGPYSGCLGYISSNGCMDMNIIIRSAILTPIPNTDDSMECWKASIGCGGAITALI